jgi:hypothetical protein
VRQEPGIAPVSTNRVRESKVDPDLDIAVVRRLASAVQLTNDRFPNDAAHLCDRARPAGVPRRPNVVIHTDRPTHGEASIAIAGCVVDLAAEQVF